MSINIATSIPIPSQVTQIQSYFDQIQALATSQNGATSPEASQGITSSSPTANPFEVLLSGESSQASASSNTPGTTTSPAAASLGQNLTSTALPATIQTALTSGGTSSGISIVQAATNELGVPYVWGGSTPNSGFDCSGLVQYVFSTLGVSLPRTAAEQEQVGTPVANLASAKPGDLLFFEPGQNGAPPGEAGHVGIYIGNGQMIAAPETGTDVQVQPVPGTPLAIRRVQIPGGGQSALDALSGQTQPLGALGNQNTTVATTAATVANLSTSTSGGTQMLGNVAVPNQYLPTITNASASTGVPAPLLAAILYNESRFNPSVVSSAGAEGIAQFMPATAAANNVNPWNPTSAIQGAANLLAGYHSAFGNWSDAIAAYAAGGSAVEQAGGIPQTGSTGQYVQSVLSLAQMEAGS